MLPIPLSDTEIVLAAALSVLFVWTCILQWRLYRLTRGHSGANLESTIAHIQKDFKTFCDTRTQYDERFKNIHERLKHAVRGVATVRFNPFADSGGGKQSFATAIVTESGDGVIISTLNARERVSIFAKTVQQFKSEHELTDEESQALENAQKNVHTVPM
jgi:hypothetical protein